MSDNKQTVSGSPSNMVVWRCPECLEIPSGPIYQCSTGHSFCALCVILEKTCPTCDVKIFGSKHGFYAVRNFLAESLLDQVKFECRWKNQGCERVETRSQISMHEHSCIYGTIYLCGGFSGSRDCEFKTHLYKSLNVENVLKHIQTSHGNLQLKTGVQFDECCFTHMDNGLRKNLESRTESYIVPTFVEVVHFTGETFEELSRELFILMRKVEVDSQRKVSLSWAFVWLNSEANSSFTVKLKLTIKGEPKPSIAAQMGNDCVPDINWTLEPIRAPKFAEWKINRKQKLDFPFSIPLSHINKHYVGINDIFTVSYSFLKECTIVEL